MLRLLRYYIERLHTIRLVLQVNQAWSSEESSEEAQERDAREPLLARVRRTVTSSEMRRACGGAGAAIPMPYHIR